MRVLSGKENDGYSQFQVWLKLCGGFRAPCRRKQKQREIIEREREREIRKKKEMTESEKEKRKNNKKKRKEKEERWRSWGYGGKVEKIEKHEWSVVKLHKIICYLTDFPISLTQMVASHVTPNTLNYKFSHQLIESV